MRILSTIQNFAGFCIICVALLFNTVAQAQDIELIRTKAIEGFYIGVFSSDFTTNNTPTDNKLNFCVWRTNNNQTTLYMPTALEYVYQLELLDTNGVALPKTKLGETVGVKFLDFEPSFANDSGFKLAIERAIVEPSIGARNLFFPFKPGYGGQPFYSPNDLFEIKQPGNYTLQIRFQFIVASETNVYKTAHIVRFPTLDYPLVKSDVAPNKP